MLSKFRSALYSAVGSLEDEQSPGPREMSESRVPKFPYTRPEFLHLTSEDEVQVAADRTIRPIMVPRDINRMPWMCGYAEAVNAGKSKRNEDNAHIHWGELRQWGATSGGGRSAPYYYFGMFDGHAGHGASTAAARQLHHIIHEKLVDVLDHLLPSQPTESDCLRSAFLCIPSEEVSVDKLVTGALEAAFNDMDALIAEDRRKYDMRGGCTALVGLFLLGRLYLANAGDSRAVVCRGGRAIIASHDFTPETERQRVRQLASRQPALMGGEFTHLDFCRRVSRRDLGKRVLYRDAHMTGWAYKTVTEEDVKFPVVCGEGKRSRVCATIGVTRGFGDHGLRAMNTGVYIKPFLLSQPEVLVIDLEQGQVTSSDVLVMATDGLWDVIPNERVAELVERALDHFPAEDESMKRYRCISAAQELVMSARGKLKDRQWRQADYGLATVDDISVFVVPLLAYHQEHLLWKVRCRQLGQTKAAAAAAATTGTTMMTTTTTTTTTTANGAPVSSPHVDTVVTQAVNGLPAETSDDLPPLSQLVHALPTLRTAADVPEPSAFPTVSQSGRVVQAAAADPADSPSDVAVVPLAGPTGLASPSAPSIGETAPTTEAGEPETAPSVGVAPAVVCAAEAPPAVILAGAAPSATVPPDVAENSAWSTAVPAAGPAELSAVSAADPAEQSAVSVANSAEVASALPAGAEPVSLPRDDDTAGPPPEPTSPQGEAGVVPSPT